MSRRRLRGACVGLLTFLALVIVARAFARPVAAFTMAAFEGQVVTVANGDTLTVLRDHTQVRIRLHGIDAAEKGQPYDTRAKQVAADLAFGKVVRVEPTDRDQYGRIVAEMILPGGRNLNRELVRAPGGRRRPRHALKRASGRPTRSPDGTAMNRMG